MPAYRALEVAQLLDERDGLQRMTLVDGSRAYCLTHAVGPVAVGDRVIVNTTAVDLALGTGGWHVVHWNLARDAWTSSGAGHVMKLRYTSGQIDVGVAEERDALAADVVSLDGRPVVVCSLHSQVPAVVVALKAAAPGVRVAYVMTDGGALPLALSDVVAALRARALLDVTLTAGHAYGGDLEAVNVPSALALAVAPALGAADAVVVGMGPGGVGTATRLGATALEVAPALDAASALGGVAIAALRWSDADARPRHRGLSHHSRTALALTARPALVAVPPGPYAEVVRDALRADGADHHRVTEVDGTDVSQLLAEVALAEVTTMGRTAADDPGFFAMAAAAGTCAATWVAAREVGGTPRYPRSS